MLPIAFIFGAILPDLKTLSVAEAFLGPLTDVDSTVVQFIGPALNQILARRRRGKVVFELS